MKNNRVLIERSMVNLSSSSNPDLLGHIEVYETYSGNLFFIYYIEKEFYASKEVCPATNKIINEKASDNDYHYSVDISFNDRSRWLGWSGMRGTHCSD